MTPKEKAEELYNFYFELVEAFSSNQQIENTKICCIRAILEILSQLQTIDYDDNSEDYNFLTDYWKQVKLEIEKL